MASVSELLRAAELTGEESRREAEILLGHVLQRSRSWLYTWPEHPVEAALAQHFRELLARRAAGEPVAYLVGEREFWGLSLRVTPDTLIPRPDTETLVEWALDLPLPGAAAVLDLGTGSGAIALALASERPHWRVAAADRSEAALAVARSNGERLLPGRVHWFCSDWFARLPAGRFHLVVSNPPYVAAADPHLQRGDLRFEPRQALAAGDDGLADIRRLIADAPDWLHPGGWLLLEHGFEQAEAVRGLLEAAGYSAVATRCDLAGQPRVTGGCRAD